MKPIKLSTIKHPLNAFRAWRFNDVKLINIFAQNGINPHPQYVADAQFIKPLLGAMRIHNNGDASKLALSLKKLSIKEIFVDHDVDLGRNVIDKMRLWYFLDKHIDTEHNLERMVIRKYGPEKCYIDGEKNLILVQDVGKDPKIQSTDKLSMVELARMHPPINSTIAKVDSPKDIKEFTVHPGETYVVLAEFAEILTRISDLETGKPLLNPEIFELMEIRGKTKLDGPFLDAVIQFKKSYMGISNADGILGPNENSSLLTYNLGYMLTKLIDPASGSPFISPEALNAMEPRQKIDAGSGENNPIYLGLKEFLKVNWPEKANTITPLEMLHDNRVYDRVKSQFMKVAGT